MKLLIHSQTSTMEPLKFGNNVCYYLSMLGLTLIHVSKSSPLCIIIVYCPVLGPICWQRWLKSCTCFRWYFLGFQWFNITSANLMTSLKWMTTSHGTRNHQTAHYRLTQCGRKTGVPPKDSNGCGGGTLGADSSCLFQYKDHPSRLLDSHTKDMGIPILVRRHLHIGNAPSLSCVRATICG